MIAYFNGTYINQDDIALSAMDRGFTLGDGVFETLFYDGQEIECLKPHFDRLMKGVLLFDIPVNFLLSELKAIILNLVQKNQLEGNSCAIRITITRGVGQRGLLIPKKVTPTVLVTINPYQRQQKVLRVGISDYSYQQPAALSSIKHLGYQLSLLGRLEADKRGLDDVLFFNSNGNLVCSTCANVFILKNGRLITPSLTDGALPGVMRGKLIQEMQKAQTPVQIDRIIRQDVEGASKVFLTNSLIAVTPAFLEKD